MSLRHPRALLAVAVLASAFAVAVVISQSAAATNDVSTTSADSYVSAATPNSNFGSATWVRMDASPPTNAYFRFDVSIPLGETITSAFLECWVGSTNAVGASVWPVANTWTEGLITWNNAPTPTTSTPVARTGPVTKGTFLSADVTAAITSSGSYSFMTSTDSSTRWSCASRENSGGNPARLVITTAPISTASASATASGSASSTPTPTNSTSSTASPTPTSTTAPPPPVGAHKIMLITFENHSRAEAMAQMPGLAALAQRFGEATNYFAVAHPSLPNYLAIWGGSTFGVTSDCSVGQSGCVPTAPSVWGQTLALGATAKAYLESMTSNCQTSGSSLYAPRHGPWPYWTDSTERSGCNTVDVPSGTTSSGQLRNDIATGNLPITGELAPNLCNSAHDCSLGTADTWLQDWVSMLQSGPDYTSGHLSIIVTFDEDDGSEGNRVAFVVIDPRLSGRQVSTTANHYSLTRWLDENAGATLLRNAATAVDLRAAFGL